MTAENRYPGNRSAAFTSTRRSSQITYPQQPDNALLHGHSECPTTAGATWDDGEVSVAPAQVEEPSTWEQTDRPWECIVWDDPVNLMTYVTYVFMAYFKYSGEKAQALMMEVHTRGRATVATGTREEMERHTQAMHSYGLWATLVRA